MAKPISKLDCAVALAELNAASAEDLAAQRDALAADNAMLRERNRAMLALLKNGVAKTLMFGDHDEHMALLKLVRALVSEVES